MLRAAVITVLVLATGGFFVYGGGENGSFYLLSGKGRVPSLSPVSSFFKGRMLREGFPGKTVLGKRVPRRIIAVALDPVGAVPYAATKFTLHRWSGGRWTMVPLKGVNPYATITAVLARKGRLWIGTGCYGVYHLRGRRWIRLKRGLPGEGLARRRHFFETVTSLELGPDGTLFAGCHFGRGVYRLRRGFGRWQKIPGSGKIFRTACLMAGKQGLAAHDGTRWHILKGSPDRRKLRDTIRFIASMRYPAAVLIRGKAFAVSKELVPDRKVRYKKVRGKRALYFNPWRSKVSILKRYIPLMKKKGLNALVVDVKDDFGRVLYRGRVPAARKTGAYYPRLQVKRLVRLCRNRGIYLIARMVTFKDPKMWRYRRGRYAIRDRYSGGAWQPGGRERWVNPFSPFVRKYNIDLAKEVLSLGFDEIQFDYIRFPTDGPIYRTLYPGRGKGAWKVDALENFLAAAKRELPGPFSVDIYGFNAWYPLGRWMGQDIALYAAYADAISPMHYPSHFDRGFRNGKGRIRRVYEILKHGTLRPRVFTGKAVIRSWIQTFRWHAYGYGPGYWERQIKGVIAGGENGYLFWDAASRYGLLGRVRSYKALKE